MQFWLLKSEPDDYSIDMLQRDGSTCWDGVRNVVARKNIRAMREGDRCFFYHSSCRKQVGIAGVCSVKRTAYPDPADDKWAVVDVKFEYKFTRPLLLPALKAEQDGRLAGLALFRQPRLSVQPVSLAHYTEIQHMAEMQNIHNRHEEQAKRAKATTVNPAGASHAVDHELTECDGSTGPRL